MEELLSCENNDNEKADFLEHKVRQLQKENKELRENIKELMQYEAEMKGKEQRQLLIEQKLINTTQYILKLSQDKEEILKDITHLTQLGKFYEESKEYCSKVVNVAHNPCYVKCLNEKGANENIIEVLDVIKGKIDLIKFITNGIIEN